MKAFGSVERDRETAEMTGWRVAISGNIDVRAGVGDVMTITMYGADWCGDCRRAKAWFDERNIAYDYVDLVDKPDETERVLERNNGCLLYTSPSPRD